MLEIPGTLQGEQWRKAIGPVGVLPGVMVSNKGRCFREPRICSSTTGSKFLAPGCIVHSPKVRVNTIDYTVLQLVARTWIGAPTREGLAVKFKDRDKTNRSTDNLIWARPGRGIFTDDLPLAREPKKKIKVEEVTPVKIEPTLPITEGEKWKQISMESKFGNSFYISNKGRCCRVSRGEITIVSAQRILVNNVSIHLRNEIMRAWNGQMPFPHLVARPLDGNIENMHPDNLVWAVKNPREKVPSRCFHVSGRPIKLERENVGLVR